MKRQQLTCENVSNAFQKYWTCRSVSIKPTWYIVCRCGEGKTTIN